MPTIKSNQSILQASCEGWVGENNEAEAEVLGISAEDIVIFENLIYQQNKKRIERSCVGASEDKQVFGKYGAHFIWILLS